MRLSHYHLYESFVLNSNTALYTSTVQTSELFCSGLCWVFDCSFLPYLLLFKCSLCMLSLWYALRSTSFMTVLKDTLVISDSITSVSQLLLFCLLTLELKPLSQDWRHCVADGNDYHAVGQMSFSRLMRHQLRQILDKNCEPLREHSAEDALFELQHKKQPHGKTALTKANWTSVEGLLKIFGMSTTAISSVSKPQYTKPPA